MAWSRTQGMGFSPDDVVGVVRLMLVPEKRERNRLHQSPFEPLERRQERQAEA